jgi:predicted Fe-Mo cluster-binding NifX family protein
MRVGIPVWGEMVSPVLDAAETLLVFETDAAEGTCGEVSLSVSAGSRKVGAISGAGVEVLICGAVTRPLLDMLESAGITVVPWLSGRVSEVLEAFEGGRLAQRRFAMPGCGGGSGRGRGGRGRRGRGMTRESKRGG